MPVPGTQARRGRIGTGRAMSRPSLRIDGDRLWDSLMEMATIGATEAGGCCRLALTDADKAGRDLFVSWCRDAGCSIGIDDMGNIFARRPGRQADLPAVAIGSHLDTQPHGGKFDGVFGVLAGLEVIRTLNAHDVDTKAPIDVVTWTNEEGARFAPAMLASGVFAGLFTVCSPMDKPTVKAGPSSRSSNASDTSATNLAVNANWTPILRPISSRDRSWSGKAERLALCGAVRANAGTMSPCRARMRMRVQRRWRPDTTRWLPPRESLPLPDR